MSKILLACDEVPYYGGAGTTLYILFELLQQAGFSAHYLNIIEHGKLNLYNKISDNALGNPKRLSNVNNVVLSDHRNGNVNILKKMLDQIQPDLIIGRKIKIPYLLKSLCEDVKVIFYTSSCYQIKRALEQCLINSEIEAINTLRNNVKVIPITCLSEVKTVDIVDKIVCHTEKTKKWFNYFYPEYSNKIAEKIVPDAQFVFQELEQYRSDILDFSERQIDMLFVANDWTRQQKNYALVKNIIITFRDCNIHVVGMCNQKVDGAFYHDLVSRPYVLKLMKNTKTVISTSTYDPAPNVLLEAAFLGCNIVASKNCGNWQLCNNVLVVNPYSLENFIEKINLSLQEKLNNNLGEFLKDDFKSFVGELTEVNNVH